MDAISLIRQAKHITVVGHVAPDGDVVGSMLGLALGLAKIGKKCVTVSPHPIPDAFRFLPGVSDVVVAPPGLDPTDLIVVLDTTDPHRIGVVYEVVRKMLKTVPLLIVDHHVSNSFSSTVSLIDRGAAAVAEQVFELLNDLGIPLDPLVANCLLTGLVADTQCFRTSSTTPRSLKIGAMLMEAGAVLPWIVECLYKTHPVSKILLWGWVLSNIRVTGRVVWSTVPLRVLSECGASSDETDGLIDILAGVPQAQVAALFKETRDKAVKVSLRSIGDVNVVEIAQRFDGGGHPRAAGFTARCHLDEIEFAVVRSIDEGLAGR